jgi:hypothetical protein
MFVVSNVVGSTIQITTLPLPVLSTLQASGLVFNTAFATLLLGEPFTYHSVVGTILTCSGAALIATFGAIGEPAHNLRQLLHLLAERDFIIWMAGTMVVVVATILVAHVLKVWTSHKHLAQSIQKHERPRSASTNTLPSTSISRAFTAQLPPPLRLRVSRLRLVRGLCYGLISGILSAHSLLVAKSAVELLVRTIVDHKNQFNRFQSWLILIALLFFALTQLYYLHLGLRLCSTSVLYPFVFCVYNIIAILDGLIYFQQGSRLSAVHAGLVALGAVILLSGVLALSWRLDDSTPSEAAHQAVPPRTPLTPGMGLVNSPEEQREPLLPTGRKTSSTTSLHRRSADEQTPLLAGHTRAHVPSRGTDTEGIWAELDDEAQQDDFLASLPRAPSPFLKRNFKTRRRDGSVSSQAISSNSRPSSSGSGTVPNKEGAEDSPSVGENTDTGHRRRNSAPQARAPTTKPTQPHARNRSTSVRFADSQGPGEGGEDGQETPKPRQPSRSRFDQGGSGGEGDDV